MAARGSRTERRGSSVWVHSGDLRVQGLGFIRTQGLGFRAYSGSGFRVVGSAFGFRV